MRTTSRKAIGLAKTLPAEANWALSHKGAIDGQLLYTDHNAVYFLSQRLCLDAGKATGFPVKVFYDKLKNKSVPIGLAGDFSARTPHGDILRGCVENTNPWQDFVFKTKMSDVGTPISPNATQYVRSNYGKHEGKGVKLIRYEYNYTADDLEGAFQFALGATSRKRTLLPSEEPKVRSGEPIIVMGYPFESGHSVLGTEPVAPETLHKDLHIDLSVLSWNRLQEAVASQTGRKPPSVILPDAITDSDLITITVLAFVSIITFYHALFTTADARRERVLRWPRTRQNSNWTLIKEACDHKDLVRYKAPSAQHDLTGAFFAFVVAAAAIIGAILHFRSSNIRYREFMLVRQGTIITYGASRPNVWAIDPDNQNAGALFAVGHWYVAQTIRIGYVGVFEVILGIYCVAGLFLISNFYQFVTLRELQLDRAIFRRVFQFFRAIPQAFVGFIVDYAPLGGILLRSYRTSYLNISDDIAHHHGLKTFDPDVRFSGVWDGLLIPRLREEQDPDPSCPTPDQVEKAAAFLASDRYGRLKYPQVLALLSSERLIKAADAFHQSRIIPTVDEIHGFWRLFYVKGVLLPEASQHGITVNDFREINVSMDGDIELIANREKMAILLPLSEEEDTSAGVHRFAIVN